MKKIFAFTLLFLSVLTLSAQSVLMKVTLTDGTIQEFAAAEVQEISFVQEPYVDLGLPSAIKWASINLGAEKDTDAGTPLEWDEVENYIFNQWTKVYGDREWRMPTKDDFQELIENCKWDPYLDAEGNQIGYKVAKKENDKKGHY